MKDKKVTITSMSCGRLATGSSDKAAYIIGDAAVPFEKALGRLYLLWKKRNLSKLDGAMKVHDVRRKGETYYYGDSRIFSVSLADDTDLYLTTHVDNGGTVCLELSLRFATTEQPYFLRQLPNVTARHTIPRLRVRKIEIPGYTIYGDAVIYVTRRPDLNVLEFVKGSLVFHKALLDADLKIFEEQYLKDETNKSGKPMDDSRVMRRGSCYS